MYSGRKRLLAWRMERVIKNTTARNVLFLYMKEDAD